VSAAAAVSLTAGLFAWPGATSGGASISLPRVLEAGANAGIAYGLVTAAFLWQLVGSLLEAPKWLADLTPFAHVGLVPTQPFRAGAAAIMIGIGLAAALGAFRRRDLLGA
jgi:ABC-2 type transport system permease protein